MGAMIKDSTTSDVLHQLNTRLGSGEPIQEMTSVHKEFKVFSGQYTLRQAYRTLHIVPGDFKERRLWFRFLDTLKDYDSDIKGVNGHDRILKAYRENLESKQPLPIYTTTHRSAVDKRVLVSRGQPIVHENQDYLVVSVPTIPRGEAPKPTLAAARAKRAAKK
jgi:hypothetical protein